MQKNWRRDPPNRGMQRRVGCVNASERTVAELNIRHYRALLTTETDPGKRRTIATLLKEEEARLADLEKKSAPGDPG